MNTVKVKVAQLCPTLCDPMDCIVHGILQTRILEWAAVPFAREPSQPRDQTQVSHIAGGFFTSWATRETHDEHGSKHLLGCYWKNFKYIESFHPSNKLLWWRLSLYPFYRWWHWGTQLFWALLKVTQVSIRAEIQAQAPKSPHLTVFSSDSRITMQIAFNDHFVPTPFLSASKIWDVFLIVSPTHPEA